MAMSDPNTPRTGSLGGLGGILASPVAGNALQAIGLSLLSSPRQAPLSGFGQAYVDLQQQTGQTQEEMAQREGLKQFLIGQGLSPEEAEMSARNPQLAKLQLETMQQRKEASANQTFMGQLGGLDDTSPEAAPMPTRTAPAPSGPDLAALGVEAPTFNGVSGDTQSAPRTEMADAGAMQPVSQSSTVDALLAKRRKIVSMLGSAPSERSIATAKAYIDGIDKEIEIATKNQEASRGLKPTAGQQDYEYAMRQLRERGVPEDKLPTYQEFAKPKSRGISFKGADGTEIQIGGDDNGGYGGTSLPAEVGGRVGLGDNFIKNDYPEVLKMIEAGDATGPIDYLKGTFGRGNSGIVQRRMATGADALRRGLTGAGMSASESEEYAQRYLPIPTDDAATLKLKAEGLKADLEAVTSGAIKGKAGDVAGYLPGAPKPKTAPEGVSEEDIQHTMQVHGLTRDQVLKQLNAP